MAVDVSKALVNFVTEGKAVEISKAHMTFVIDSSQSAPLPPPTGNRRRLAVVC